MTIKLSKPFTANNAVDEFDVRQMKGVLNRLGYYQPYEKTGITGIPDAGVFAALKVFQRDHGLPSTGMAKPGDKTIETLNVEAGKTPEGFYVWRTCEDDKVRAVHAAHDWETRAWGDSPDPSEEFNCRCWAAPATSEQVEKKKKQKCFDKLTWEAEAIANIKRHELDYEYPYLDSEKKITVGYGTNIDKKTTFIARPWKTGSKNGPDATMKEIERGYKILRDKADDLKNLNKDSKFNMTAKGQEGWANLYLSDDERGRLFKDAFSEFRDALPGKFADFNCFPPKAKIALMDMIYNIGAEKFSRGKWKSFFPAVNQRDWDVAAQECHRTGIGEERNTDTYGQFKDAAEVEAGSRQKD